MSLSNDTATTENNNNEKKSADWKHRVHSILSQDRHVENFSHYTASQVHRNRMAELAQVAPELYNNPDITPRATWFTHPRYRRNSQMPPYHVHFRSELQTVIRYLYQAHQEQRQQQQPNNNMIRRAAQHFDGSMRGLHGHVNIEEYACFPLYQETFPHVPVMDWLVSDHQDLHRAEDNARTALQDLVVVIDKKDGCQQSKRLLLSTLIQVMDFDDQLMAHLGEEEEIVVPISLTDKPIWF